MTTDLKIKDELLWSVVNVREMDEGIQYRFRFSNDYGASVIKTKYSYGHERDLWEFGVLYFDDENHIDHLTYDTDITDDVLGCLTDEEVEETLLKIKELDEHGRIRTL